MSVEQKAIRHMQRARELLGAGELGFGGRKKQNFPLSTLSSTPTRRSSARAPPVRQQVRSLDAQVQECKEELAKCKKALEGSQESVEDQQELAQYNTLFIDKLQSQLEKIENLAKDKGVDPTVIDDIKAGRDKPSTSGTH